MTIYLAQQLKLPIPNWINFYINDFLCMPIILSLCLAVLRIIKKPETLYVPLIIVLALTTYFAICFEWLVTQISTRDTRDISDTILYYLGAILFFNF